MVSYLFRVCEEATVVTELMAYAPLIRSLPVKQMHTTCPTTIMHALEITPSTTPTMDQIMTGQSSMSPVLPNRC